ncbi:hypothetical protein V1283_007602 [Bradyrhizobium sp. AZCC 2262]
MVVMSEAFEGAGSGARQALGVVPANAGTHTA